MVLFYTCFGCILVFVVYLFLAILILVLYGTCVFVYLLSAILFCCCIVLVLGLYSVIVDLHMRITMSLKPIRIASKFHYTLNPNT